MIDAHQARSSLGHWLCLILIQDNKMRQLFDVCVLVKPTLLGTINECGSCLWQVCICGLRLQSAEQDRRKASDAWSRAAKEVTRLHNQRNPDRPIPISGDELADVIRSAARGALDMLQQGFASPFCLEGTTLYSRIRMDTPKTDRFSGLYLGTFGPHGPEVLHLQRSIAEVRPCLLDGPLIDI